jgi:type IV secretory pathway VirB10-like protein
VQFNGIDTGSPSRSKFSDKLFGFGLGAVALLIVALVSISSWHTGKVKASTAMETPKPPETGGITDFQQGLASTLAQEQKNMPPLMMPNQPATTPQAGMPNMPSSSGYFTPPPTVSERQYSSPLVLSFKEKDKAESVPANTIAPTSEKATVDQKEKPQLGSFACGSYDDFQASCVPEGTVIDAVMVNRLGGEFAGPVKVMVSEPVYSVDRKSILIPEGTVVLGEAKKVGNVDEERLAVAFHRLIMPDGYSISLDQLQALDQGGSAGLHDIVNRHWVSTFGAAIAIGLLGGLEESGTGSALTSNGIGMYRQGISQEMGVMGQTAFSRFLNRMPTITIREGTRAKVYIAADLNFKDHKGTAE